MKQRKITRGTSRPRVLVSGHQKPDADSAVSACIAARLKQRLDPEREYQPILLGEANAQTHWLFQEAGLPLPPVWNDLRFTVGERMTRHFASVRETAHLAEACDLLHTAPGSLIAVLTSDGNLAGVLSDRLPQSRYFYNFNSEDYLGLLLPLPDIVSALRLRPLHRGLGVNASGPGTFRVGSCTLEHAKKNWTAADVVLTGPRPDLMAVAAEIGVRAVLLADCEYAEAKAAVKSQQQLPAFYFGGSLMGLIAQLPMAIPVSVIMNRECTTLSPSQGLDEIHDLVTRSPHALPVIDDTGRMVGTLSKADLLDDQKRLLILVDHFERNQSAPGIEQAELLEIIDHHRIGNIETFQPVRVDCRPVGSTASILAAQFAEAALRPSAKEALLLLGALISDTLLLTSPTTTPGDKVLAENLARRAQVDLLQFGREVLRKNDELATAAPSALVSRDLKEFQHGQTRFVVGQIETVDFNLLDEVRREALQESLCAARLRLGVSFAVLMITDVFRSESLLLISDEEPRRAHFLVGSSPQGKCLPGMVSRKKQLIPKLLKGLNEFEASREKK